MGISSERKGFFTQATRSRSATVRARSPVSAARTRTVAADSSRYVVAGPVTGQTGGQHEERRQMQTEWKTRSLERVGVQMSALGDLRYDYVLEARYLKEGVNPGHPPIYEYTLRIVEKS